MKEMKYFIYKDQLHAFDKDTNFTLKYEESDQEWDIADIDFEEYSKNNDVLEVPLKDAMNITGAYPPDQFIDIFLKSKEYFGK